MTLALLRVHCDKKRYLTGFVSVGGEFSYFRTPETLDSRQLDKLDPRRLGVEERSALKRKISKKETVRLDQAAQYTVLVTALAL